MAPTNPAKLRSLYRALLRELPPRPVLASPRPPLHQRLRDRFHPSSSSAVENSSSTPADVAVAQAEQYLAYFRAQRTYTMLLERYNPGSDMDDDRVRLTARRVGLDMPVEYSAEEK